MLTRPLAALAAGAALLALAGCSGDDSTDSATDPTPTSASSAGSSSDGATCDFPADSQPASKEVTPPPGEPTVSGDVPVTITLNAGVVKATLDGKQTPCTVTSFVSLAEQKYFDDTPCHRLTTAASGISVLQCGDPSGTGMGGPGYTIPDELTGAEKYPAGTLAMANTGVPGSGGSQFFIVYGSTPLPPSYTVFGKLDPAGLKVVKAIGAKGVSGGGADGAPKDLVTIESVTVD